MLAMYFQQVAHKHKYIQPNQFLQGNRFPLTTENCISIHQHTLAVFSSVREGKSLNFHRDLITASAQLSVHEKEKIFCEDKKEKRKKVFQEKEKIFKKIFIAFGRAKRIIKAETAVKRHRKSMEDEGNWFWASD